MTDPAISTVSSVPLQCVTSMQLVGLTCCICKPEIRDFRISLRWKKNCFCNFFYSLELEKLHLDIWLDIQLE
jgi:hypothetical protein